MSGGTNFLEMSDEDILNMTGPGATPGSGEEGSASTPQDPVDGTEAVTEAEGSAAVPAASGEGEGPVTEEPAATETPTAVEASKVEAPAVEAPAATEEKPAAPEAKEEAPKQEANIPVPSAEEAQSFYMEVLKPFKANGKMITLRNPQEAISLMQMGANYTRKMQELQPHRKTLLMLQNNNLDPDKLSFLIDLDRGDPEAVKKFIKDRGIDPMDIDTTTDPAYLGGNHLVSDEEASFRSTLEDLGSTPVGQATIVEVNTRWDNASKELLWKNPEVLTAIQEQRESGVYDAIVAEMDRQITLGKLRPATPFLEAYRTVGDQLVAEYAKQQPGGNAAPAPAPQVLATRAAAPKSAISNSEQAAAAAPSRGTATKAKEFVNPLEMDDEAFLKQMNGRV